MPARARVTGRDGSVGTSGEAGREAAGESAGEAAGEEATGEAAGEEATGDGASVTAGIKAGVAASEGAPDPAAPEAGEAAGEATGDGEHGASHVEAVSAYLWKVFAATVGLSDQSCRMGSWVNGRRRRTTAPEETRRNYVGYVTAFAVADASTDAIQRRPLPEIASMMRESIRSTTTDEHFQELLDWVCHIVTDMWAHI